MIKEVDKFNPENEINEYNNRQRLIEDCESRKADMSQVLDYVIVVAETFNCEERDSNDIIEITDRVNKLNLAIDSLKELNR